MKNAIIAGSTGLVGSQLLEQLIADGRVYGCSCTRKQIAAAGRMGAEGPIYPGTCRDGLPAGRIAC